jgi:hypothetical protein
MARTTPNPISHTRAINRSVRRKSTTTIGMAILFRGSIDDHTTPFPSHHSEVAVVSQGVVRKLAFRGRGTCISHRIGSRHMLKAGSSGAFGVDL